MGLSAVVGPRGNFDIQKCWVQSGLFHLLTEQSILGLSVFVFEMGLISEPTSYGVVTITLDTIQDCRI